MSSACVHSRIGPESSTPLPGTRCCRCSPPEQSRPASHRSCLRASRKCCRNPSAHRIESGIDAEPCPSPKHHSDLGPRRAASGTARVVTQQRISDGRAEGCGPSRAKCLAEPGSTTDDGHRPLGRRPCTRRFRPTKRSSISAIEWSARTKWTPTPSITTIIRSRALLRDDRHGSVEIHSHLLPPVRPSRTDPRSRGPEESAQRRKDPGLRLPT